MKKYHVRYKVEGSEEGYTPEELGSTGERDSNGTLVSEWGGTDILICTSIVNQPDGGRSYATVGFDGIKGSSNVSGDDLFKAWAVMACKLMDHPDLKGSGRAFICKEVHEAVKKFVMREIEKTDDRH